MNIFETLNMIREPVFNSREYKELEPVETLRAFTDLGLIKKIPFDKVDCDECAKNCRKLPIKNIKGRLHLVCPDGYMEEPKPLGDEEIQGWQFDFNRLKEMAITKSGFRPSGASFSAGVEFYEIACGEINNKTVSLVYCWSTDYQKDIPHLLNLCQTEFKSDILIIITPDMELRKISGIPDNIYPVTLQTIYERDFDMIGIISDFLPSKPVKKVSVKFPTPAGTKWDDITIIFTDDWSITVSAKEVTRRYGFGEMGFSDGRKGAMPDIRWRLLRNLAKNKGYLSWDSKSDGEYSYKNISDLRNELRRFFSLKGDPFLPYKERRAYITKFKVEDRSGGG